MKTLTLESFIASLIRNQYRKFGMANWGNSTIPSRTILLSEKQTYLYDRLFRERIVIIEKIPNWNDGVFTLKKDEIGMPSLFHKSGMCFSFTKSIRYPSFAMTNFKTNKNIWIKNFNNSFLNIKLYKNNKSC